MNVQGLIRSLEANKSAMVDCHYERRGVGRCKESHALDEAIELPNGRSVLVMLCVDGDPRPVCAGCWQSFLSNLPAVSYAEYLRNVHGFGLPKPQARTSAPRQDLPRPAPRQAVSSRFPASVPANGNGRPVLPPRACPPLAQKAPLLPKHATTASPVSRRKPSPRMDERLPSAEFRLTYERIMLGDPEGRCAICVWQDGEARKVGFQDRVQVKRRSSPKTYVPPLPREKPPEEIDCDLDQCYSSVTDEFLGAFAQLWNAAIDSAACRLALEPTAAQ